MKKTVGILPRPGYGSEESDVIGVTMNNPDQDRNSSDPCRDAGTLARHYEDENARLAHHIHNGPAQKLTAAMIELGLWQSDLEEGKTLDPELIRSLIGLLQSVSAEVREATSSLRPRALDLFGLSAAVESLASRHGQCEFRQTSATIEADAVIAIQLLRATETVLRCLDRGSRLELTLGQQDGFVVIHVTGQTVGAIPDHVPARLRAFGGSFQRDSGGATIRLPRSPA